MATESYTPGWSATSVAFMARRTLAEHGQELEPFLGRGMNVLDVGCGPAVLSRQIAARVAPGNVVALDVEVDQIPAGELPANLSVRRGTAYELSAPDGSVDVVFAHAVVEHLERPLDALREFGRVLRPGGHAVVVSPDWGGFVVAPVSDGVSRALAMFTAQMEASGGDPLAGRHLGQRLLDAGFVDVQVSARYECYADHGLIAEYLAQQLDGGTVERQRAANALRQWATQPAGLFAQCWVAATGRLPF